MQRLEHPARNRSRGASLLKILAILSLITIVVLAVGLFAVQYLGNQDPRASTGRHIYLSLKYYADAHDGTLPLTLEEMVPKYFIEKGEDESRRILKGWELLVPGAPFEPDRQGQRLLVEIPEIDRGDVITIFADGRLEYHPANDEIEVSP